MSEVSGLVLARRRYERERDKGIKAGTWQGLVKANPARQHVKELHRIWLVSYEAISKVAGVSHTTVKHLAEGTPARQLPPPARITARISDILLTVTVDDLPDNYLINAVGSARRLQALAVAGWPAQQVADRAGADPSSFKTLRRGERITVILRTARLIQETFEELIQLDPYEHVRPNEVTACRNMAATKKWLPAAAWADAIDDPAAKPWEMVRCSYPACIHGAKDERLLCGNHLGRLKKRGTLEGLRVIRNSKALIENARFILATDPPIDPETEDIDRDRLAERLGMTWDTLERALLRAKINLTKLRESA
ncbi:hypothetical protein ACFV0L_18730 [Streptosporangium canum]|uniref:hypothetical protein n=1 Tax=Streptosporangium canum TaxID=324952 RepID=UPI003687F2EC